MTQPIKRNIEYFEAPTMAELHARIRAWQEANNKRFQSLAVEQDGGNFCCIALTNPSEVVITDHLGIDHVHVTGRFPNALQVATD